ncbi:hypothetical protein K439DRAFT_1631895 [Ramaria rubella]|nr:hypothetical protein K439DRAFT_1631895 [Ramaria rubella]
MGVAISQRIGTFPQVLTVPQFLIHWSYMLLRYASTDMPRARRRMSPALTTSSVQKSLGM